MRCVVAAPTRAAFLFQRSKTQEIESGKSMAHINLLRVSTYAVKREDRGKGRWKTVGEMSELERAVGEITEIAKGFGLDFYPMRYEICPPEVICTFGAYGMPTRFSHWSFGKTFHKMKLEYDLNLSRIYQLVINSNPCYAFLLKGNSLIQNKLIVAHVLAHCDFFKNNARFANTSRDMVESMAASAERIRQYELQYGKDRVESFLDDVLAIQEHIDPSLKRPRSQPQQEGKKESKKQRRATPYDDLWELDEYSTPETLKRRLKRKSPPPRRRISCCLLWNRVGVWKIGTGYINGLAGRDALFLAPVGDENRE